eukprot:CAMPEP_0194262360 /NCGR_PEP_ID=MMETSP0158-20130606/46501_1 /TAXON_ID=33649 /ORGANISM="Thalassionema nitzschioides, Strain L26-B" /LENGTH=1111 /DNA_ID=CAMNT_0039002515 /DNA_START=121 /DNA_END=3456 /DNA_ORIENTATION=+
MQSATNTRCTNSTVMSCVSNPDSLEIFQPAPLFGRDNELLELKDSYQRIKDGNSFEKVMVHGNSGTGKTSLVLALQESVLLDGGLFCSGKYFQNTKQEPYSAIMTAFSDLCDLVLQSDGFDEVQRARIEKSLGSDGVLLVNAVSNISTFLGDRIQDACCSSLSQQSFPLTRFKVACKRFIRAMVSDDCPVVLFIDDIQWMDNGSRQLLEAILQDEQITNFMLIMAYREEESSLIKDDFFTLAKADVDLKLGNIDLQSVQEMISERLEDVSNGILFDVDELCRIISHKTNGNPLHILKFLEMIKEDGLLTFDDDSWSWTCDLDEIQKNTMIPDSVAEIISKKIERLDKHLQDFLKLASLIGYRFTHEMIFDIATEINEKGSKKDRPLNLDMLLRSAMEANIVEKANDGYQFTHDKLQAAFQERFDKHEKEEAHLKIGTNFLRKPGEMFKYLAALHLNCVSDSISNKFDNKLLAKTNLQASKYCECRYAFLNAADFLRTGVTLLGDGEQKWLTDFDLAFELTESLAKMELILGNMDACINANRIILQRAKSEKAKVNALSLEIEIRTASSAFGDNVPVGKKVLRQLGINVPPNLTPFHLISKLRRVRKLIDSKKDEEILSLHRIDPDLPDLNKVMLLTSAHFFQKKKFLWVLYATLLAMEYTITNGFSSWGANTLCYYGVCETIVMRNPQRGYRLGRLALQLNVDIPFQDAGVVNNVTLMLMSWHKERIYPKDLCFNPEHLNEGLENGNFPMAVILGCFSFYTRFWTGEHLLSLELSIRDIYERLSELGQKGLLKRPQPLFQLILIMLMSWHKERIYPKDLCFNPEHLNEGLENGNFPMAVILGCFSFYTRFWTGEHLLSLELSIRDIYERLSELGQKGLLKRPQPLFQLILNLRKDTEDNWEELLILTGEAMDEEEYRNELSDSSPPAFHTHFWFCKTVLAYNLGFYSMAEALSLKIPHKSGLFMYKSLLLFPYTLYKSLIYCARYRETGSRTYLHKARKCRKLLEKYHSSGNPNATPHLHFAEAEELSSKSNNPAEVQSAFDNVIEIQAEHGLTHLEALANERASDANFHFGNQKAAKRYLDAAIHAYEEKRGETMKREWLLAKYDDSETE